MLQPSHDNSDHVVIPLHKEHIDDAGSSFGSFVGTALVLPIASATVLPLSLAFQTGKFLVNWLTGTHETTGNSSNTTMDSGYVVDQSTWVPRSERTYDIVVLGATGFTGYLAARYLTQKARVDSGEKIKFAIAGRSQEKLNKVKARLAEELNDPDIVKYLDTIIVDTLVPATLPKLVANTRVVASTAGPFGLFGNGVVEFCAKFGTHYVDITGEVDWVRKMCVQWQSVAEETGARLVPFCGQDSIPWDMLVLKLDQLLSKDDDKLVSVTFWDEFKATAPGGTMATIDAGVEGRLPVCPKVEVDPFLRLPKSGQKSEYRLKPNLPSFIQPSVSPWDTGSDGSRWTVPFVMADINARVVGWSHALRQSGSNRLIYSEMQVVPNFRTAFSFFFGQLVLGMALYNPLTKGILKSYVFPKPGEGPSKNTMEKRNFLYITGEGISQKGSRAECALYFAKDTGCLETARMLVESALFLAQTREESMLVPGGFWPPSIAMGDQLLDRILNENTKFAFKVFPKEGLPRSKL